MESPITPDKMRNLKGKAKLLFEMQQVVDANT